MTIAWLPPQFAEALGDDALWNAVAGLAGENVALDEQGTAVSFALGEAPAGSAWVAECLAADGGPAAFIHFREFPFGPLFEVELTAESLSSLPPGLRDALVEGMFNFVAMASVPDQQTRPRMGRQGMLSAFAEAAEPTIQWFDIRLAVSGGALVALDVACRRDLAARIAAQFASARPAAQQAIASRLSVPVDFTLGAIELPLSQAASLEPGAIAVLGEGASGGISVRLQDMLFDFEPAEQGWACKSRRPVQRLPAQRTEAHMDGNDVMENEAEEDRAEPVEPTPDREELAIGDLRIAIDFDIGRRMVPVSELSAWQPGAIVQLEPPQIADGVEVTIRANGDIVGSGDIVRVDDRLAVRITRLSLRG